MSELFSTSPPGDYNTDYQNVAKPLTIEAFEDVIRQLEESCPVNYQPHPVYVLSPPKLEGEVVVCYGIEFEAIRDETGALVWNRGELTEEAKEILRLIFL